MFNQLPFRKKIFLSQLIVFLIFFLALFPIVDQMTAKFIQNSLVESTTEVKEGLEKQHTEPQLISFLQNQTALSFFRMSLINPQGYLIYDSHLRLEQPYYVGSNPEVKEAVAKGIGYAIATSSRFKGKFAYVAEAFSFHGNTYLLRTAFPYEQVHDLTKNFKVGFLIFFFFVLLIFNAIIWVIFTHFTQPIRQIIYAITPYQKRPLETLPKIVFSKTVDEDFQTLANTLNAQSHNIQEKINVLRLERNEKEAILDALREGILVVNESIEIIYCNPVAKKMLHLSQKNDFLEDGFSKGKEELKKACCTLIHECRESEKILTKSRSFGQNHKTHLDLIAIPTPLNKGVILVLQDTTSQHRVIEIGQEFVANASHELRTPITIIKGYAETLQEIPDLSKEQFFEIIEKISRNCLRMESLVKNLLQLATLDNLSQKHFVSCDVATVIDNSIHTLLSIHPTAQCNFTIIKDKIFIEADPELLEQAIGNLLENAVKYSSSPAHVTVQLDKTDREAVIKITDFGKGIPEEDIEHIFERFYRVDKTHSRRSGGAGLGLSIVKTIIDKHQGTISVTSKVGQGSIFTLLLPLL